MPQIVEYVNNQISNVNLNIRNNIHDIDFNIQSNILRNIHVPNNILFNYNYINRNNVEIIENNINIINNFLFNNNIADQRLTSIYNQTVHDLATETTIQESINKLRTRYKESELLYTSLEQSISFLRQKVDYLVSLGKLMSDEKRVIEANFNSLLLIGTNEASQAASLLGLAINALEDQNIAQQMCIKSGLPGSPEKLINDMCDRWAGWFKSAIIDSQLAYRRDRGDMSIPNDAELNQDKSCFRGMLNRIIMALNLLHPDVNVQEGQGTLANIEQYRYTRKIAIIKEFGQNPNKLQVVANQYLVEYLATICIENLKKILLELENIYEAGEDQQKSELLTSLENRLQAYVLKSAKLSLKIENVDLIKQHLQSFISAYIDIFLEVKIKEVIEEKTQYTSPVRMRPKLC